METILLKNIEIPDLDSIDVYMGQGGYGALEKTFALPPEEVISMVEESGLRGRGGGGFPAGTKWKFLPKDRERKIYLICNADEGEPGTFKDRQIMQYNPHQLIEGMAVTAYAIGAHFGFIYIRGEYDWIAKILVQALEDAEAKGFVGDNILDSGYSFQIDVFRGAGSYVCGEETALMESLEGRAGRPRLKPPFPALSGLYGEPTLIHNVVTLACIPFIIKNGPDAFRAIGKPRSYGTRVFGVSGHVNKPGAFECPLGISLKSLIYEFAGGIKGNKGLKAVIPGGISSPILLADEIDLEMDFESLAAVGSMLGTGGVIVIDEDASIPLIAQKAAKFYAHESCGQCTPCREGLNMIKILMDRIVMEQGSSNDLEMVMRLCRYMRGSTLCPMGDAAAMSIGTMIRKFRGEFEELIHD